ncbi:MAG: helix-turn-helix domain-containing protein [Candidatus Rokubacteria bacterium]|nr:helix-turn-helix domain-containing protein [Candidatus Rokubacteria bacterium]
MGATPPAPSPATPSPPPGPRPHGFHGAVSEFKRRLIEATLTQSGGNRTHAARALGLQRTYLLRLMREFQVHIPPPPGPWRRADNGNGAGGAHAGNGGGPVAPTQRH